MGSTSISIRVDAWVELVGSVGVVWAGIGGAVGVGAEDTSGGSSVSVGAESTAGSTVGSTSVSIRVYSWVQLVGSIRVVWASSACGSSSVGRCSSRLMLRSESSSSVSGVCRAHTSSTSITIRANTGIQLVGNVGVVRTGGIGGCGRVGRGVHEVVGRSHDCGVWYWY